MYPLLSRFFMAILIIKMPASKQNLKICKKGHRFYKSSDCPTCPVCEKEKKPLTGFLSTLSAPARRALESKNIITLKQLTTYTESELLQLHGLGPSTIKQLRILLKKVGLHFKN